MPQSSNKLGFTQLRVGIFVLIALVVLALLILNSTGDFNPFRKNMVLKARFATADGLREGGEVQLAGVHIGKVKQVKFLPTDDVSDDKIEAIMEVQQLLDGRPITERIRTDSTAQLIATSVLSNDKMINITPGTVKGIEVTKDDILKSSTAISINQLTSTGNDLLGQINKIAIPANEILNKANNGDGTLGQIINNPTLFKNIDSTVSEAKLMILKLQNIAEQAKSGNGTAGKLLNDPQLYNNVNQTISKLDGISQDIQAVAKDIRNGKGTAGKLLTDDALYNDTRATIAEVKTSLEEAKGSIKRINKIADEAEILVKDLNAGKGTAGKLLKDEAIYDDFRKTLAKLNTTTERVDTMLADAQNGKGTVGKLLTDDSVFNNINKVSDNINQISSEGTKMIYDFRQNPKKYLTIKLKLF
jgi:phospholipid/cholesterol/gamma-HCH transport system substrate-binding protein